MSAQSMYDAVYGCLIGGAIGDALGAPVEGWHWSGIREKYGRLTEFRDYDAGYARGPGHMTDDSYLRHLLCMSIVAKNGRVTPDDFAALLKEKMNPDRLWTNELLVLKKIQQGMNPWWETGRGTIPAGCATMAIAPIGIVNAGDPAQGYQDAFCVASVDQDGNNRDFAATFAAGIAAAFTPGATEDTVIDAMFEHSDYVSKRALTLSMNLARDSRDIDEYIERFYTSPLLDWTWPQGTWDPVHHFCGNSIEFVPAVPAILHFCKGDPNRAIIEGANFGRDCDTIGSCCGCVVGVLHGASALNRHWIDQSENANADVFEELHGEATQNFSYMAQSLVDVLDACREQSERRAKELGALLARKP